MVSEKTFVFSCTQEAIASSHNPCEYVQLHCENHTKYLNFIDFYYCTLGQDIPITILLSVIFVFVIFNLLKTTADRYLAPSLEAISDKLKMSETLAGVTLVAFANGATDVIAGLSAGGKEGGIQIAIGALFGATLFTITCVLARCIQGAGEIEVNAGGVKRDIGFLLIAVGYFIMLSIMDTITLVLTLGFFVIYITYFLYVLKQEQKGKEPVETVGERLLSIKMDFMKTSGLKACSEGVLDNIFHPARIRKPPLKQMEPLIRGKSVHVLRLRDNEDDSGEITLNEIDEIEQRLKWTFWRRFMKVINAPFFFIRDLTMPPFEEDNWNVARAMVTPFFGGAFVLWQLGFLGAMGQNWYFWLIYFSITVPVSLLIFISGRNHSLIENHPGRFAGATFVVAAFWLSLIVTCFMDFLSLLTLISGLPLTYLSLTMIAWGNSFDNFFIDYVISKSGHGKLAVTGVFSGKIFNLLVGFGIALLIQSLSGCVKLNLYDFSSRVNVLSNLLVGLIIFAIIGFLLSLVLFGRKCKWIFGKKIMHFSLIFYLIFFIIVTIISIILN